MYNVHKCQQVTWDTLLGGNNLITRRRIFGQQRQANNYQPFYSGPCANLVIISYQRRKKAHKNSSTRLNYSRFVMVLFFILMCSTSSLSFLINPLSTHSTVYSDHCVNLLDESKKIRTRLAEAKLEQFCFGFICHPRETYRCSGQSYPSRKH